MPKKIEIDRPTEAQRQQLRLAVDEFCMDRRPRETAALLRLVEKIEKACAHR